MLFCGKTGIRTLGTVTRSPHFECGPIDHSGIFPLFLRCKSNGFYDKLFFFCPFFYAKWGDFLLFCCRARKQFRTNIVSL